MHPTAPHHRRRAFTLIELLTVIAIISILISILLPSLSGARQRARITKCQANLREIDNASLRYVGENDDIFPVNADCSAGNCIYWNGHQYFGWNGRQTNEAGNVWIRPVNRELGLELTEAAASVAKIAECPGDTGAQGQTGTSDSVFVALGTSYPLNPILCQGRYSDWKYRNTDINLSQINQPSLKVLVGDHVAFGLTFDGFWTGIRPGWHDQFRPAAVVGFIDGHAEYAVGANRIREWQWYGEASGAGFVQNLTHKVGWAVLPGSE